MPTYEYSCKSCAKHLEVVQSFNDEALTECPSCQGQLRKVFVSIGIAFKGSGFYKTDSRSSSSATSPSESSSSEGATKESSPEKTDSSPDKTADTSPKEADSAPAAKGSEKATPSKPTPAKSAPAKSA